MSLSYVNPEYLDDEESAAKRRPMGQMNKKRGRRESRRRAKGNEEKERKECVMRAEQVTRLLNACELLAIHSDAAEEIDAEDNMRVSSGVANGNYAKRP